MKQQVSLLFGREPLQITVPPDFSGERSDPDAQDLWVSTTHPGILTLDEIGLVEEYLKKLPYRQALSKGAIFIDADDPLLELNHDQLDKTEKENSLMKTRFAPGSGERSTRERVLILRESGYLGNGFKQLASSAAK